MSHKIKFVTEKDLDKALTQGYQLHYYDTLEELMDNEVNGVAYEVDKADIDKLNQMNFGLTTPNN